MHKTIASPQTIVRRMVRVKSTSTSLSQRSSAAGAKSIAGLGPQQDGRRRMEGGGRKHEDESVQGADRARGSDPLDRFILSLSSFTLNLTPTSRRWGSAVSPTWPGDGVASDSARDRPSRCR